MFKELHSNALARPAEFVIQIAVCEVKKRMKCKMAAGGKFQSQTRMNITDGDNMMVAIVATEIASRMNMFEEGNLLKVTKYNCISYLPEEGALSMLSLLILDAVRVGVARHVFPKPPGLPVDVLYWSSSSPEARPAATDTEGVTDLLLLPQELIGDLDADDIAILDAEYYCDGSLCTTNGIQTRACLLRRQEMPELCTIQPDCFFADRPVDDMTPSQKRCMLYWWWAVNVFQARGKGMRVPLPTCVVFAIRRLFPNPVGQAYKGFKHS